MTRKPRRVKMASMRSRSRLSGWRWPMAWYSSRQRDVDRTLGRTGPRRCLDALTENAFDVLFGGIGELSEPRSFLGGRRAEGFEQRRDEAALPRQVLVAEGAEVGLRAGAGEILLELLAERFEGSDRIRHPLRLARAWRAEARPAPRFSRGARRPPGSRRRGRPAACDRWGCPQPSSRRSDDGKSDRSREPPR